MAVVAGDVDFSTARRGRAARTLAEPVPALKGIERSSIPRGELRRARRQRCTGKSTLLRLLAGRHTRQRRRVHPRRAFCAARGSTAGSGCRPRAHTSDSVPVVCATAWRWTRRWRTDATPSDRERNSVASHTGELRLQTNLASVTDIVTGARDRRRRGGRTRIAALDALEAATGVNKLRHRDTSRRLSDGTAAPWAVTTPRRRSSRSSCWMRPAPTSARSPERPRSGGRRNTKTTGSTRRTSSDGLDDWRRTSATYALGGRVAACEVGRDGCPGSLFATAKQAPLASADDEGGHAAPPWKKRHGQLCRATRSSLRAASRPLRPARAAALDGCSFAERAAASLLWVKMARAAAPTAAPRRAPRHG